MFRQMISTVAVAAVLAVPALVATPKAAEAAVSVTITPPTIVLGGTTVVHRDYERERLERIRLARIEAERCERERLAALHHRAVVIRHEEHVRAARYAPRRVEVVRQVVYTQPGHDHGRHW